MNTKMIAAVAAVAIASALLVAYVGGRLWVQGATDQVEANVAAMAEERSAERAAESARILGSSHKLTEGMTADEVLAIMGEPSGEHSRDDRAIYHWTGGEPSAYVSTSFRDGAVISIERYVDGQPQ